MKLVLYGHDIKSVEVSEMTLKIITRLNEEANE